MPGQVVDEHIHVDLAANTVKLLFKPEINSEPGLYHAHYF